MKNNNGPQCVCVCVCELVIFPLVKAAGRAVDNTPPSSAEVKKE